MQKLYINQVRAVNGDLQQTGALSEEAKNELQWWIAHLSTESGNSFAFKNPDLSIFCDSSLTGWGASCEGAQAKGPWTSFESQWHINELELKAALLALQSFTSESSNQSIHLLLDNSTAVAYINKRGGTKSNRMNGLIKIIVEWCERRSLDLTASHVPGISNTVADKLSREASDSSDWMLNGQIFSIISEFWPTDLDLFASSWNKQISKFVSWKPPPEAWGLNAFSIDWSNHKSYLFPPFALIGRCLGKIRAEEAEVVLIAPVWQSQSWFPDLLNLVCEVVRILPNVQNILTGPKGECHPMVALGNLTLAAWKLSGNASVSEEFRRKYGRLCRRGQEKQRPKYTNRRGEIGFIGVVDGVQIPCTAM